MTPTEKQPRWKNTMKCCVAAVSISILLYKGHAPATLHLARPTFHPCGSNWQICGSDKSAPPSHTTHVEIGLVCLSFVLPGPQLDGPGALTCASRKITLLLHTCSNLARYSISNEISTSAFHNLAYYLLHQPLNALFLDT